MFVTKRFGLAAAVAAATAFAALPAAQAIPSATVTVNNVADVNPGLGIENGFVFTIANTGVGLAYDITSFGFQLGSGLFDVASGGAFGGFLPWNFYPLTPIGAAPAGYSVSGLSDGSNSFNITFAPGFGGGESFSFAIDADRGPAGGLFGALAPDLNGSSSSIGFANSVTGSLVSQTCSGTGQFCTTYTASYVPEPGSIALIGIGLAGAALANRRKRKDANALPA